MGARVLVVDDSPTIRRVVEAILSRNGFDPVTACDGQAALETLDRIGVDVILLDFVMPRMNGYQFCRALRAHEKHKGLPVVLMSAKAERIRDQFLRQTGAIDAITKPFDARGLVAVVEGALQRVSEGRAPLAPRVEDMPEETALSTRDSLPAIGPGERYGDEAFEEVVAGLSELVQAQMQTSGASDIKEIVRNAFTPIAMRHLFSGLRWLALLPTDDFVLYGDTTEIPVAEILQLLQLQRQSGTLEVFDRRAEVSITLREGHVDLAQSSKASPEFLLGRYFVERNCIDSSELPALVEESRQTKVLLGNLLLSKGIVQPEELRSALIQQTSELIYDVLRWKRGWFVFHRKAADPKAQSAALRLPVASIVMEGFRRVDEWRVIEESIDFDEVLVRNDAAISTVPENELTDQERAVLAAVDGQHTVRELIGGLHQSSFDTCKTFYRLMQSRLVRRKAS